MLWGIVRPVARKAMLRIKLAIDVDGWDRCKTF
jgi:hypothetical protein